MLVSSLQNWPTLTQVMLFEAIYQIACSTLWSHKRLQTLFTCDAFPLQSVIYGDYILQIEFLQYETFYAKTK